MSGWNHEAHNESSWSKRILVSLTAEQREQAATELKRFAADLNLTEDQKEKLHAALTEARERVGGYLKTNPNVTKADFIAQGKSAPRRDSSACC